MAATAVVKLVELFIDAEAQAKRFQKELLQSASTIEFMGANAWDTDKAFGHLEDTVKQVRAAAYDIEKNWAMGLKSADFTAVLNSLNQAGVSIHNISAQASKAGKTTQAFVSELVHVNVAYSRAFGQPLSEIGQLQTEMITELGMGLEQTKLSFAQMGRHAADSGIAANKFFSIIRGASQDMSLYNMRMGDAVKTLKMLSKVMNPRNAQKFFSEAMQGLKGMGREEKLRLTMLAGTGNVQKAISADIESKTKSLSKRLTEATSGAYSAKEIKEKFKKGGIAALEPILKTVPDEMQGALREGFLQLGMQGEMAKKGTFGTAMAAGQMGMPGAISVMTKALGKFGGGKKLMDVVGTLQGEMMAQNLGISEEQLQGYAKTEYAIDAQRKAIADELGALNKKEDLTKEEQERLKQLNDAGFQSGEDVMKAELQEVWDVMDGGAKQQAKDAGKAINFAERQTELTTSLMDRLEVLIEFMMNQLYDVLMDFWKMFATSTVFGSDESQRKYETAEAARNVEGPAKAELMKVSSAKDRRAAMAESEPVKAMNKAMNDLVALEKGSEIRQMKIKDLANAMADPEIAAADPGGWDRLKALGLDEDKYQALKKLQGEQLGSMPRESLAELGKMVPAMKEMVTVNGEEMTRAQHLEQLLEKKYISPEGAMNEAGITTEMRGDMMSKMPWLDEDQEGGGAAMITRMGGMSQDLEKLGYPVAATEKTAEQTEKGAKASAKLTKEATSGSTIYVKFPDAWLTSKYQTAVEDAVLAALRQGLFEYFLYSGLDRQGLVDTMKTGGMSPEAMAKEVQARAKEGKLFGDVYGVGESKKKDEDGDPPTPTPPTPPGGQGGGAFTRGGLAMLHGGEYLVPRHGVPVGGGGAVGGGAPQKVIVEMRGDAARVFRATAVDAAYEARRRERRS
jgi:hypothetical protein